MGSETLLALSALALGASGIVIACVVAGSRYDRARDEAWAEFGRTHPLLVSREIGDPPHGAPSTSAPRRQRPGKGAKISGGRA